MSQQTQHPQIVLDFGHKTLFMLYQLKEQIYKCKNISEEGLRKIMMLIRSYNKKLSEMLIFFIDGPSMAINYSELQNLCDEIRVELNNWLKEEQQQNNTISHLFGIINENIENADKYSEKFQNQKQIKLTIKQQRQCNSFAFNKNATIIFVGQIKENVKIYGFNSNHKQIKTLLHQSKGFIRLIWMEKSKLLLSCGRDSQMILWNQEWKPEHILQGHTGDIVSIIVNQEEDLIISGSADHTIKFWKKIDLCWICIQTLQTAHPVINLILNPSQTKLISCYCEEINLIELNAHQQWIITQQLSLDLEGYLKCFISDNQFVFSPDYTGFLLIYNYQQDSKQFIQNQSLLVSQPQSMSNISLCHFIKENNILILNCQNKIYFFQLNQNGFFELFKSIDIGKSLLISRLTDDGQYLAIWNQKQQEIQMTKFRSKN